MLNSPIWIEIHLLASFMRNWDARRNSMARFMKLSCLLLINTWPFQILLWPCRSISVHTVHPFLSQRVHHAKPEPLHLQGKHMEFGSDQAYTPLDNCTPTVGSLRSFVFSWKESNRVRWCLPEGFLSCILWNTVSSPIPMANSLQGHGGQWIVWLGIVSSDSHRI